MMFLFNKLENLNIKYNKLNEQLLDPDIIIDNQKYAKIAKELNKLAPIVEKYREYCKVKSEIEESQSILNDTSSDKELSQLAQEQYDVNKQYLERILEELKILLLPQDENDEKNVIVEIRSGAGGDEAALFANSLFRMYNMYSESRRWKVEILSSNITELGGIKEISFLIEGKSAYSRLKFESGVHRVQRVPDTETSGRIHTSTVTVAVLPEVEDVEIEINSSDLEIDTFRASGAGGQHVNKTESAIRITHVPTGTIVECQEERSQYKNKDRAMKILRSKIYEQKMREQNAKIASERKLQVGTGDRSERIRTYNFPQGRVTDHRIGLTLYKIDSMLNGDMDEIIDALITFHRAEKLNSESIE